MNHDGTRLATASDKGTIIRVFSIPDGAKLFQFRRGSMPARIFSMSFDLNSTLLCVSSATETVHIFRLAPPEDAKAQTTQRDPTMRRPSGGRTPSPDNDDSSFSVERGDTPEPLPGPRKHNGTFAGMIRRTSQNVTKTFAATVSGYLPTSVSEMLEPARDFAWFKIPKAAGSAQGTARTVVAFSSNNPQVMAVTTDGEFLVYDIDMEDGGECVLAKQYS